MPSAYLSTNGKTHGTLDERSPHSAWRHGTNMSQAGVACWILECPEDEREARVAPDSAVLHKVYHVNARSGIGSRFH